MTEAFLQYVWRHQLMCTDRLCTLSGEDIRVLFIGVFNSNAGPDFLNAKIQIGETIWAGDVEIHLKSSDWDAHKHHLQQAYNSVILHVVLYHDKEVFTENGRRLPTLITPILPHVRENYMRLSDIQNEVKCGKVLSEIDSSRITLFMDRLVAERFERKAEQIVEIFRETISNWNETWYRLFVRYFGCKVNGDAMDLLAKSLPLKIIQKHTGASFQVEALLFGVANLWSSFPDEYEKQLHNEADFLLKKYGLTPMSPTWWKFARMRPYNFPTIRIAQMARLFVSSTSMTNVVLEMKDLQQLQTLFSGSPNDYWQTHFVFGKQTNKHSVQLGEQALNTLIINTVIPFLFAYGKERNEECFCEQAYDLLMAIPPEKNHIITEFKQYGVEAKSAYETQALLQLYSEYCCKGNCVRCAIGHVVLKKQA
ncbi:MAG: DUF2851 family protein [Bacteroidales bacterium]|nr:DUF2851 family protein [Bacteroidales bacterium]